MHVVKYTLMKWQRQSYLFTLPTECNKAIRNIWNIVNRTWSWSSTVLYSEQQQQKKSQLMTNASFRQWLVWTLMPERFWSHPDSRIWQLHNIEQINYLLWALNFINTMGIFPFWWERTELAYAMCLMQYFRHNDIKL